LKNNIQLKRDGGQVLKYKIYSANFFIARLTTTHQISLSTHPKQ